jgi:hypothetical protein
MKKIHGLQNQIQSPNQLILCINTAGKQRNSCQIKSNVIDTLNDADNLDDFEDICINTAIDTISVNIASKSKNSNYDGMIEFRAPSSARGKHFDLNLVTIFNT